MTSRSGRELVVARRAVIPVRPSGPRGGRPAFAPTDEMREHVTQCVAHGISHPVIASMLGISHDTLSRHFATELEHGLELASSMVAGAIYRKAVKGDVLAGQFWLKSRAKWRDRDAPVTVLNAGSGDVIIDSKRSVIEEMRARREAAAAEATAAVAKAAQSAQSAQSAPAGSGAA